MNTSEFIAVTTASTVRRWISEKKVKTSPETSPEVNNKDGDKNNKMDIFLSICIILLSICVILLVVFLIIISAPSLRTFIEDLLGLDPQWDGALIERLYAIDAKVEKWLGDQLFVLDTEVNEWLGLN